MITTAVRMLFHDRSKCMITIVGVTFAVMLVLVQVGLFRGLLANATISIEQAEADLWITSRNTPNIDFPHYFSDAYVQRVRSIPGVSRADNLLVSYTPMQLPSGAEETVLLYGIDDPVAWKLPWSVVDGTVGDVRRGSFFALDDSAARRFGPFSVGDHRELFGQRLEIIGKTRGAISFTTMPMAFASLRRAQTLDPAAYEGRTGYILVKLDADADAELVAREIRERLPFNDVHTRSAWASKSRDYWIVNAGIGLNMGLTVFLGVLIGTVVVAQTLYASALDHTKEFGTLKAIGATNAHLCGIVGCQALVAALAGYVLALPLVFALREAVQCVALDIVVTAPFSIAVLIATVALCLFASMVSFRRVATIDPALVFRS